MSRVILGCMRISDKPLKNIRAVLDAALEIGVNAVDHADIYGGGKCEKLYGELFRQDSTLRDRLVIQTKCGIAGGMYDLSQKHIMSSVEGSLSRLNTDHIDILLLHRPDALLRPEEIAAAFTVLHESGKVRCFGVSNFSAGQIDFLQSLIPYKLQFDQMQLSPTFCPIIEQGMTVNTDFATSPDRDGSLIWYCRKNGITLQSYGSFQCSFIDNNGHHYSGAFMTDGAKAKYFALNFLLNGLAQKYGTTPEAVSLKWILHHPANIQAIVGTTLDTHMLTYRDCCDIPLTDREWYDIYKAAGHALP